MVIGQTLTESSNGNQVPQNMAVDNCMDMLSNLPAESGTPTVYTEQHEPNQQPGCSIGEPGGHSRNSSNTSQMSKASGYSSIHSSTYNTHSRQSSSGDSGHIRYNFKILIYFKAYLMFIDFIS